MSNMVLFKLPKSAFKCEGVEVVAGHRFLDGELLVGEDQAKAMASILIRFYGVDAELIQAEAEDVEISSDPSLAANVTKPV